MQLLLFDKEVWKYENSITEINTAASCSLHLCYLQNYITGIEEDQKIQKQRITSQEELCSQDWLAQL